ncbi:protein SCARECROW-like [Corylus avellana]|uniref:protein SCARECROW-like n=1 Tax=Corylus avellana TaxID=13451 RepID=UPI00286BB584|nr:protein SCARECROW-like [Corylus avellana]XP_059460291.1 protein SCARECROW-like [Corylus avellana]
MGIVRRLSAEDVMKIAKEVLIQNHVFGLSHQETIDVELACLLLASAEKVAKQEHDEGSRLLSLCDFLSSKTGSSVQRTVHYFTKALQQRIDREAGGNALKGSKSSSEEEETMAYGNLTIIACYLHLPFSQITQFAGIQAIVESVASVKRVHYIDLAIRTGAQCIVLMQALATRHGCPIELLKVTAIGISSKQRIEETGKRLARFADTLTYPFHSK